MTVTILYREQPPRSVNGMADGDDLWLAVEDVGATTGWELRPEGACRGSECVPIPAGRQQEFVGENPPRVNVAALARLVGEVVVHDDDNGVWRFGEPGRARRDALRSLEAPNFTLPDLAGGLHSLADYRGKKVFLASWASW